MQTPMFRRRAASLAVVFLVAVLGGCGNDKDNNGDQARSDESTTTSTIELSTTTTTTPATAAPPVDSLEPKLVDAKSLKAGWKLDNTLQDANEFIRICLKDATAVAPSGVAEDDFAPSIEGVATDELYYGDVSQTTFSVIISAMTTPTEASTWLNGWRDKKFQSCFAKDLESTGSRIVFEPRDDAIYGAETLNQRLVVEDSTTGDEYGSQLITHVRVGDVVASMIFDGDAKAVAFRPVAIGQIVAQITSAAAGAPGNPTAIAAASLPLAASLPPVPEGGWISIGASPYSDLVSTCLPQAAQITDRATRAFSQESDLQAREGYSTLYAYTYRFSSDAFASEALKTVQNGSLLRCTALAVYPELNDPSKLEAAARYRERPLDDVPDLSAAWVVTWKPVTYSTESNFTIAAVRDDAIVSFVVIDPDAVGDRQLKTIVNAMNDKLIGA